MTSFIPLLVFIAAVGWIIWRGYQAKAEYMRRNRTTEHADTGEEGK